MNARISELRSIIIMVTCLVHVIKILWLQKMVAVCSEKTLLATSPLKKVFSTNVTLRAEPVLAPRKVNVLLVQIKQS
jgi:hypothetical protein